MGFTWGCIALNPDRRVRVPEDTVALVLPRWQSLVYRLHDHLELQENKASQREQELAQKLDTGCSWEFATTHCVALTNFLLLLLWPLSELRHP